MQLHRAPVSILSKAGLAVRARIKPIDEWYIQAAVYDGDPVIRKLKSSEGKMYIVETGFSSERGEYKADYWQYTADKIFNGQTFSSNYGYYGIIDQELVELDDHMTIGGFVRRGAVPSARNEIINHVEFGLHMH